MATIIFTEHTDQVVRFEISYCCDALQNWGWFITLNLDNHEIEIKHDDDIISYCPFCGSPITTMLGGK